MLTDGDWPDLRPLRGEARDSMRLRLGSVAIKKGEGGRDDRQGNRLDHLVTPWMRRHVTQVIA